MTSAPLLALEGVVKRYGVGTPGVTDALRGVDLLVGAGEFTAIVSRQIEGGVR